MIPPVRSSTASFPLDHATHPRRAQRHSVVDYVRFGTCDDDGYAGRAVRERSWAQQEYHALESAGCCKERLGGWFGVMSEVRLPSGARSGLRQRE
jgi:hypothetical protein